MATLSRGNPFGEAPNAPTGLSSATIYRFNGPNREASWKSIELFWQTYTVDHASAVARHRYPNVAGQTIEPLGREPLAVEMETVWFGADWRRRLDNFLWALDREQSSGALILPDGRAFNAFCTAGRETYEGLDGCTMPLSFEEDTHLEAQVMFGDDPSAMIFDDLTPYPATQAAAKPYVDAYLAAIADPSRTASREMLDAFRRLDAVLFAAQEAAGGITQAAAGENDALALARWHTMRAFPLPDLLG